jgi:hypothetical protein
MTLAAMVLAAPAAAAAPTWQSAETLELFRGAPDPVVGINAAGNATVAYSVTPSYPGGRGVALWSRAVGGAFHHPGLAAEGTGSPQIAVAPNGATAIAAPDRGRLVVTVFPAPGFAGGGGMSPTDGSTVPVDLSGMAVEAVRVSVDASGQATVVWASPHESSIGSEKTPTYVATVTPSHMVIRQTLGAWGNCHAEVDVDLRGDAVVSRDCSDQSDHFFFRAAGETYFGAGEEPFAATAVTPENSHIGMAIDGSGTVHAFQGVYVADPRSGVTEDRVLYSSRPPGGGFAPPQELAGRGAVGFDLEAQEDGDVIAAWPGGYAWRPPGGPFGTPVAVPASVSGFRLVSSANGPALMSWRQQVGDIATGKEDVRVARIHPSEPPSISRVGVSGYLEPMGASPSFAINDAGQAVGAWEQRCARDGALAVMAVALDEASTPAGPPCQDRAAPKVIAVGRRASLVGRLLRVRLACDEACRLTANARVTRRGHRSPLATAKTKGERRLGPRRGARVEFRLSATEARRLASALRARRKVSVRLAVSVRDRYGNGARRRLVVRLVR